MYDKKLLFFLQTNCKEEALIYAEYSKSSLDKERYAINSIRQLNEEGIVLFFSNNCKPTIPSIKVKDAIMKLQNYNENDNIFFCHNNTKYYVLPYFNINSNDDNHVYLLLTRMMAEKWSSTMFNLIRNDYPHSFYFNIWFENYV